MRGVRSMKKYIIVITASILLILGLCGWKKVDHESLNIAMAAITYEDEETGVEYIVFHTGYGVGVCPRYNADGTLYTSGKE